MYGSRDAEAPSSLYSSSPFPDAVAVEHHTSRAAGKDSGLLHAAEVRRLLGVAVLEPQKHRVTDSREKLAPRPVNSGPSEQQTKGRRPGDAQNANGEEKSWDAGGARGTWSVQSDAVSMVDSDVYRARRAVRYQRTDMLSTYRFRCLADLTIASSPSAQ